MPFAFSRRALILVCFVAVFAAWTYDAAARDYYVNNELGDDRRDGLSPKSDGIRNGPYRTIRRALRAARWGDRVILAKTDEPYRESITLHGGRHSGSPDQPFSLIGNGAILDGTIPVPEEAWRYYKDNIYRFRPTQLDGVQLFIDGQPIDEVKVTNRRRLPKLEPMQWYHHGGTIYFRPEKARLPQDYPIHFSAKTVGLTLYEVRNVVIDSLVLQGYQLDGVNAHDNVFNTTLISLTSRGNGRSGISVGGASNVRIEACLIGNNTAAQVRTEGFSKTQIVNCDLLENTAPAVVNQGGKVELVKNN